MKILSFIFLIITLFSCGHKKHKNNPEVARLNNQIIPLVRYIDNPDSCRKALLFLDSAISIDSNNFLSYYNKIMFLNTLKEYDKAVITINKLISLAPNAHDLYLQGGMFYEKSGDTISSKIYFQNSLDICDKVLDTINLKNRDYEMIVGNKALNLFMLNERETLKTFYSQQTSELKEAILPLLNKTKDEYLDER